MGLETHKITGDGKRHVQWIPERLRQAKSSLPLFASPFWLDDLTGMAWPKHFKHLIEKHIEALFQDVKRLISNWADSKLQLLRQISRSYP